MTEYTKADLEIELAKMTGRKPAIESTGGVMGLRTQSRSLEDGARVAAMESVKGSGRDLLNLLQGRSGLTMEAAAQLVNEMCKTAYESASRNTPYESERFMAAYAAIEAKGAELKRKMPLVTESQGREIRRASLSWVPDPVTASVHAKQNRTNQKGK